MKELKEEQKKKGRPRRPRMEDLIPDPELRERVTKQLYGDEPLFGKGSVFSEMLQAMVKPCDGEDPAFSPHEVPSQKHFVQPSFTKNHPQSTCYATNCHTINNYLSVG